MARVPLTRNSVGQFVRTAQIVAGTNVTIAETVSGSVLTVTVSASGGGGGGTPASSVVSETSYGQSPVVGTSTDYARGDHSHGTPAIPAHSALSSLAWNTSGHTGNTTAVAAWNASGSTPVTVQATTDETMLARRGGILQWVAIPIAAVAFTAEAVEIVEQVETFAVAFTAESYPGTIT